MSVVCKQERASFHGCTTNSVLHLHVRLARQRAVSSSNCNQSTWISIGGSGHEHPDVTWSRCLGETGCTTPDSWVEIVSVSPRQTRLVYSWDGFHTGLHWTNWNRIRKANDAPASQIDMYRGVHVPHTTQAHNISMHDSGWALWGCCTIGQGFNEIQLTSSASAWHRKTHMKLVHNIEHSVAHRLYQHIFCDCAHTRNETNITSQV